MNMRVLISLPNALASLFKGLGDGKQRSDHEYIKRERSADGTHWVYTYAGGIEQTGMALDDKPAGPVHQIAAPVDIESPQAQIAMADLQPAPATPAKKLRVDRYGNYGLVEMLHHLLPKKRKKFAAYKDDHKIRQRVKRDVEIDISWYMIKEQSQEQQAVIEQQARDFLADYVDPYYMADSDGKVFEQYRGMDEEPLNCAVRLLINLWASTSGDTNKHAMAMQIAAIREFKLENVEMNHMGRMSGRDYPEYREFAHNFVEKYGPFLQRFLRAQYDHTQHEFQQHKGGPTVVVYRGVKYEHKNESPPPELAALGPHGGQVTTRLQPMSSFAAMYEDADIFAGNAEHHLASADEYTGYIMAIEVPNNMILSTARTGYGCLHESEVVILGGEYEAFVMPAQRYTGETQQHEWHRDRPITRVKKARTQADFIRAAKKAKVWSD